MKTSLLLFAALALLVSGDSPRRALAQTGQAPDQIQNLCLYDGCGCQIMLDHSL